MRYLLLAYADEARLRSLPPAELDALSCACEDNNDALRASGRLLAVEALQGSETATTVWVQRGKLALGDRPYAAMPEQLYSLLIVDARDLNEAIQLASRMPQAQSGPIEIRPLLERSPEAIRRADTLPTETRKE